MVTEPTRRGRAAQGKPLVRSNDHENVRVPSQLEYDTYISRSFEGVTDFDIADDCLHNGINLLVYGPTGPGKSKFAVAYAARERMQYFAIPSSQASEPSRLFGRWVPNRGTTGAAWIWQYGPVVEIVRNGGVLYINELNMMQSNSASVLFPLLDWRREITLDENDGEVIRAHRPTRHNAAGKVIDRCWCPKPDGSVCSSKWVLIIADYNPGYEGTRPLNKALMNRFGAKLAWDYDTDVESWLVLSPKLREMASAFRTDKKYTTPVSTNMLQEFEATLVRRGPELAALYFVNAFSERERGQARVVVDTYLDDIKVEVARQRDNAGNVPSFASMTDDEIYQWRLKLKPGEADPEWGIYMQDWKWKDE